VLGETTGEHIVIARKTYKFRDNFCLPNEISLVCACFCSIEILLQAIIYPLARELFAKRKSTIELLPMVHFC
jgi:hypothetical protein